MSGDLVVDSDEEQIRQLLIALENRTVIGQATGIVMERYKMQADQAFAALVRVSSSTKRKVHDVAVELVATGTVDGVLAAAGRLVTPAIGDPSDVPVAFPGETSANGQGGRSNGLALSQGDPIRLPESLRDADLAA